MKRQTEWINGEAHLIGEESMEPWALIAANRAAIQRLARYEDTGKEPCQVSILAQIERIPRSGVIDLQTVRKEGTYA